MLVELFHYLTTPTPRFVRKMGYLHEAIATQARYKRHKSHWQGHLAQTQQFILSKAQKCEQRRKALILGSGTLLDIPLQELSTMFEEVILVDIVHLHSVCKQARAYPNVQLVAHDLTGIAQELYNNPESVPQCAPDFFLEEGVDLVVSANILSQLPIIPRKWLEKHGITDPEVIQTFCWYLISAHIDYLRKFSGVKCLVTDVERTANHLKDGTTEKVDLLYSVHMSQAQDIWDWHIAPPPEISSDLDVKHRVVGVEMV